jgi:hypothetical protein
MMKIIMNKIDKLTKISKALALGNEDVTNLWKNYFTIACNYLGIKDITSINVLFEWGENGHNWEQLWLSENPDYKNATVSEIYQDFTTEAMYISDRMSLDRLFRTHWLYNVFKKLVADEIYKTK